jgi:hypothetical protein
VPHVEHPTPREENSQKHGAAHDALGLVHNLAFEPASAGKFLCSQGPTREPVYAFPESILPYSRSGVLSVVPGASRLVLPFAVTILGVSASVGVPPTGAAIVVDVNADGATLFTTQDNCPRIVAGAFTTSTEVMPDVTSVPLGQGLTVDIDQVGSGEPGANLLVLVRCRRV